MSDNAPPVELPDDILNLSHFTLKATLFIEPARLDEFMGHFKKCFDEITSRPECEFFEVYTSPQREPGVVQFVEDWNASPKWLFEVEHAKPYFLEYRAATEPLYAKPREMEILQRAGPEWVVSRHETAE